MGWDSAKNAAPLILNVMRKKIDLSIAVKSLQDEFNLDVTSPFTIKINGTKAEFDCLIKGYGAKNGMVIDRHWSNISPIAEALVKIGYGYSCFDLREGAKYMNEALKDWGKN